MSAASPALAGPPYQTDDPDPTDLGKWEIYNFLTFDGRGSDFDGEAGLDLNYGAVDGVQLTATLPLALAHDPENGWRGGAGDVEVAVKYRFVDDAKHGWKAAVFPRVMLPTSSLDRHERARLLLPLWVGKDFHGGTSLFGGAGYELNPGKGNSNFWQAGAAVTQDISDRLQLGTEIAWQGADTRGGKSNLGVDVGVIGKLGGRFSLLAAGGPGFSGGEASYHVYAALGVNF